MVTNLTALDTFLEPLHKLFAEDGIWESPDFGKAVGHARIKELFQKFQKTFSFSQHNMTNPLIEVNGDRATGVWYISGPWDYAETGERKWFALRYDDEYVKIDGEWKYSHLRVRMRMVERPRSARIWFPIPHSRASAGKPSWRFASTVSRPDSCSS